MTPTTLPGLIAGPPPANAPPVVTSNGSTPASAPNTEPETTFANALTAAQATQDAPATTVSTPPPAVTTATTATAPTDGDALLALLMSIARGADPAGSAEDGVTAEQVGEQLLPDRTAEAGETEVEADAAPEGSVALEALLAFLVMGQRTPVEETATPSLPGEVHALVEGVPLVGEPAATMTQDALPDVEAITNAVAEILAVPTDTSVVAGDAPSAAAVASAGAVEVLPAEVVPSDAPVVTPVVTAVAPTPRADAEPAAASSVTPPATSVEAASSNGEQAGARGRSSDGGDPVDTADLTATVSPPREHVVAAQHQAAAVDTPDVAVVTPPREARVVDAASMTSAVADTVQSAVLTGDGEVRLVLNPPDLGHLDVTVTSVDGALRVRVEASQAATRDAFEQSLPQLHQAFEARDLRVERVEVRATDTGRGSLDTSGSGQRSGFGSGADGREGQPDWSPVASFDGGPAPVKPMQSQAADGRIDVLA